MTRECSYFLFISENVASSLLLFSLPLLLKNVGDAAVRKTKIPSSVERLKLSHFKKQLFIIHC